MPSQRFFLLHQNAWLFKLCTLSNNRKYSAQVFHTLICTVRLTMLLLYQTIAYIKHVWDYSLTHEDIKNSSIKNKSDKLMALLKNMRTLNFKSHLHKCVFHCCQSLSTIRMKQRNTQNGSKYTQQKSQTMTFWACWSKTLFPKRSGEMIDSIKKHIRHLGYKLQNSHVFEMCSIFSVFSADWHSPWRGREICHCICERT